MEKHEIQARIDTINNEMIQTKAHHAKLEGHLGEAQFWLLEIAKKESESKLAEETKEPTHVEVNDEDPQQAA